MPYYSLNAFTDQRTRLALAKSIKDGIELLNVTENGVAKQIAIARKNMKLRVNKKTECKASWTEGSLSCLLDPADDKSFNLTMGQAGVHRMTVGDRATRDTYVLIIRAFFGCGADTLDTLAQLKDCGKTWRSEKKDATAYKMVSSIFESTSSAATATPVYYTGHDATWNFAIKLLQNLRESRCPE